MNQSLALLQPLRQAMANFAEQPVKAALANLLSDGCVVHMAHPFCDIEGREAWYDRVYRDLYKAIPDLERRDFITIAGQAEDMHGLQGDHWIGCAGHYVGTFSAPWLDIPPTGHFVHMRFHEFYRVKESRVVEMQVLWDIPELMMQAKAWPMAPPLGREGITLGPASADGLHVTSDATLATNSKKIVFDMLEHLLKYPSQGGPEVMQMHRFWHPRCTWYGPAGVGTCRGIDGFRTWHQTPFLNAMPDRGQSMDGLAMHFFADAHYVAVTGWPNMRQTLSHDGWLGMAPTGQTINLCSLDFWRIEQGLIKENWVLFDVLGVFNQLGVDVLARMRQFNQAKRMGKLPDLPT